MHLGLLSQGLRAALLSCLLQRRHRTYDVIILSCVYIKRHQ